MPEVHVRLREWETLYPDSPEGAVLRGRSLQSGAARSLADQLLASGVMEILELHQGLRIRAFAWVGRIQLGDLVVTIEPKIGAGELLALLRYTYGLRELRLWADTRFATGGELLQDLLAAQLLAEGRELMERGLSRRYVPQAEELATPRGRIDVGALARRWPPVSTMLPCRHHPRSSNHFLNRVLLSGVRLAQKVAQDRVLRNSLRTLGDRLSDAIEPVPLNVDTLERAQCAMDRLVAAYQPAIDLIELLLACSSLSLNGDTTTALPGFLFDMNRFFQALVGRLLREQLPEGSVKEERVLSGMMLYVPTANPRGRKPPAPRPDFVVQHGNRQLLLDAKYRDLWDRDLPREMLYQIAMYALSQPPLSTAAIVYPSVSSSAAEAVVEIRDPVGGGGRAWVALRPLSLLTLVSSLRDPRMKQVRRALVRDLAFGTREAAREREVV